MGIFLSTPKTDKESEEGSNGVLAYGSSAMQGWRRSMEDTHIACLSLSTEMEGSPSTAAAGEFALFGVFDGHGGTEVSKFVEAHLKEELVALPEFKVGKFDLALRRAFHRMDELLSTREGVLEELEEYRRAAAESQTGAAQSQAKKARTKRSASEGDELVVAGESGANGQAANDGGGGKRGISAVEAIDWFQKLLVNSETEKAEKTKSAMASRTNSSTAVTTGGTNGGSSAKVQESTAATAGQKIRGADVLARLLNGRAETTPVTAPATAPVAEVAAVAVAEEEDDEDAMVVADGSAAEGGKAGGNCSASDGADGGSGGGGGAASCEVDALGPPAQTDAAAEVRELIRLRQAPGQPRCNLADHKVPSGCTSVVALIAGDKLYVANAGDSRAIVCRAGKAIPLSEDHKPQQQRELERIQAAGGFVTPVGRVNGNLNLSRSIGDLKYKQRKDLPPERQIITAEPDVYCYSLTVEDEFLVLACDGVWDCMTTEEVAAFVRQRLPEMSPAQVCEAVFDSCIAEDPHHAAGLGGDNMTMILVRFVQTPAPLAAANAAAKGI